MKVEPMLNYALLDGLINKNHTFLLFKEPHSPHPNLAVFSASSIEYVYHIGELNGKSGFVFAPFEPNKEHPIVLLHESRMYAGYSDVNAFLESTVANQPPLIDALVQQELVFEPEAARKKNYETAFEACHTAVVNGDCQKVVLSRRYLTQRPLNFSPARLFELACDTYEEAYVYVFHTPLTGTWLGSTPEALLMGDGDSWQTVALAGTQTSKTAAEAIWDTKNCLEQQIVSDYIESTLSECGINPVKKGPYSIKAAQLVHLKTTFQFIMPSSMKKQLGTLIDGLHPTPATCGFPKEKAMQLIQQYEHHDRSYYCGFLGSIQESDVTRLYVNLRCMCILSTALVLYAGGGIMVDSSCDSEWEETESKLQTLLSLLA